MHLVTGARRPPFLLSDAPSHSPGPAGEDCAGAEGQLPLWPNRSPPAPSFVVRPFESCGTRAWGSVGGGGRQEKKRATDAQQVPAAMETATSPPEIFLFFLF